MAKELNTIIVLRNDKSTDWANSEVILREGELGVSYIDLGNGKTNVMVKAGNGTDKFADLPQVESVLESDMMLTYSFGKHVVPSGGSLNAGGTNMTMSQWIADALKQTVEPTILEYPNVTLSASCPNSGASLEIGSYITSISYTGKLDPAGKYETAGKETASGLSNDDTSWKVTLDGAAESEKSTRTGTYTPSIQINNTTKNAVYATVSAEVTLDASNAVVPTNNLGEASDVKITGFEDGTTTKTLSANVTATGYRNTWYYVGTDHTSTLDSSFFRNKATAKNSSTTSFGTVTIPAGTTRVAFAVLGDKALKSVIDVKGQGLDVKDNFTKETVAIKGANDFEAANYSVFHFENEKGIAATEYTVTIG